MGKKNSKKKIKVEKKDKGKGLNVIDLSMMLKSKQAEEEFKNKKESLDTLTEALEKDTEEVVKNSKKKVKVGKSSKKKDATTEGVQHVSDILKGAINIEMDDKEISNDDISKIASIPNCGTTVTTDTDEIMDRNIIYAKILSTVGNECLDTVIDIIKDNNIDICKQLPHDLKVKAIEKAYCDIIKAGSTGANDINRALHKEMGNESKVDEEKLLSKITIDNSEILIDIFAPEYAFMPNYMKLKKIKAMVPTLDPIALWRTIQCIDVA